MGKGIRVPPPYRPPFKTGYRMGDTVEDSFGQELVCFDYANGKELADFVCECLNTALSDHEARTRALVEAAKDLLNCRAEERSAKAAALRAALQGMGVEGS